jgi:hypothetical protein
MVIKTEVTPEEKAVIKAYAKSEGKTMKAYLRDRALSKSDAASAPLMQCIEIQSRIAQRMNDVATSVLKNKAVYESDILELLDRMTELEKATTEVLKHGNIGK